MKKIINSLIQLILFPLKLLKKTRIDNFVGGLIFGAVFSLFVNIVTVKVQEDINRQRILEAVEREIVQQSLDANNYILAENEAAKANDDKYIPALNIGKPYPSKIWDSAEAMKYIFELESTTAGKIESHYNTYILSANEQSKQIKQQFDNLYNGCNLSINQLLDKYVPRSIKECNDIYRAALVMNNIYNTGIIDTVDGIRLVFHPTQDRLNSWWLSLLLGKNAHPVMQWSSEKPTIFKQNTN